MLDKDKNEIDLHLSFHLHVLLGHFSFHDDTFIKVFIIKSGRCTCGLRRAAWILDSLSCKITSVLELNDLISPAGPIRLETSSKQL